MKSIAVLGSTGSIGILTLDVIAHHQEHYKIYALSTYSRIDLLFHQCVKFQPKFAVVNTVLEAKILKKQLRLQKNIRTEVIYGAQALCDVASAIDCQIVVAAIVGAAGLHSILAAARTGKKILLANKEGLVMSGQLLIDTVVKYHATLLPIDSEHNAIFQCLPDNFCRTSVSNSIAKIFLTASGGPFLKRSVHTLDNVTPEEAIAHPIWNMGKKISVDSATMMNKGLEVIEAHWLFGIPIQKIEVIIHPQSIIHSMVSYIDGSILAQLSKPDMRTPIANALAYPQRIDSGVTQLDLVKIGSLFFEYPDFIQFPCLKLAYDALLTKGNAPIVLNAANEIAVEAFLNHKIGFSMIYQLIARVMDKMINCDNINDIDTIIEQDKITRLVANSYLV